MLRSCPTAVELYKNVAERGKWGELLMEAHSDHRRGRLDEALVKYLILAELGYEVAQSNVAFMLDRQESEQLYDPDTGDLWKRALVYWTRAASQGTLNFFFTKDTKFRIVLKNCLNFSLQVTLLLEYVWEITIIMGMVPMWITKLLPITIE